jgi:hypothetical protein
MAVLPSLSFLLLKTCCGGGSYGHIVVVGCGVVLLSLSLQQVDTTKKWLGGLVVNTLNLYKAHTFDECNNYSNRPTEPISTWCLCQGIFMAISCGSHGGKSTMLVGSMFHWYKAKHPKSTRISIRRQFLGLASFPNFAFFAIYFAKLAIFRKAAVSKFRAKSNFLKISPKNQENDHFWGLNFVLKVIFEMADFGLVRT